MTRCGTTNATNNKYQEIMSFIRLLDKMKKAKKKI